MRIVAFNSSPRGEKGNTHVMVREFLAGASEAGAEVENIFLAGKRIDHCRACFVCWVAPPGKCVIEDDMAELRDKFISADVVVMATPLHTDNISGMMKVFMDRMIPIIDPHFEADGSGETRHVKRHEKYPKLVVISSCGFPEQTHFQIISAFFKRLARNMHSEVIGEIYRGAGGLLTADVALLQPILAKYKALLRQAGREIVEHGKLSDETHAELEKPLITPEIYLQHANQMWDRMLAQRDG